MRLFLPFSARFFSDLPVLRGIFDSFFLWIFKQNSFDLSFILQNTIYQLFTIRTTSGTIQNTGRSQVRPFNRKKFLSNPHGEPRIHAFSRGRQPETQPSTYRQRIKQSAVAEQAVRHAHNRPKKHKKDALMGRRSATHKYAFIDIGTIGRAPSYYGYSQEIYTR